MRSSCINHPTKEPINVYRQWQVSACEGNISAAIMLNFFEYWHNIKVEILERQQEMSASFGDSDETLLSLIQWHTTEQIEERTGLKRHAITKAIKQLESLGFVKTMRNPNPRYSFDATRHFLFCPEIINEWLDKYKNPSVENCNRGAEISRRAEENCNPPEEFCKYPKTSSKDVLKDHHDHDDENFSENRKSKASSSQPTAEKPNDAADPFYNGQARQLAREVAKVSRQMSGVRNFITEGPWGALAEELDRNAQTIWEQFRQWMIAKHLDKKDPEAYVNKIANNLYQNPGSEHVCKPWTEFADHYRKNLSAPPPPQKKQPRQVVIEEIPDREESAKAIRAAREARQRAREHKHD
jgi:hypothetical protein